MAFLRAASYSVSAFLRLVLAVSHSSLPSNLAWTLTFILFISLRILVTSAWASLICLRCSASGLGWPAVYCARAGADNAADKPTARAALRAIRVAFIGGSSA